MDHNEFPPNSHAKKAPTKPAEEQREKKKLEPIVKGDVVRRKKPLGRRFKEVFAGEDGKGTLEYVFWDVAMPAAKDLIFDVFNEGLQRKLYGESVRGRRGPVGSNDYGKVAYNSVSNHLRSSSRREPRREVSRRSRGGHNFDEIVIPSRAEAEEVITMLFTLIEQYDTATVSDFYELVGEKTSFTDEKFGWESLEGAHAIRVRGGYILDLPRPIQLDR